MPPKTIYIVRHCDKAVLKKDDNGLCIDQGYNRAELLVGFTGTCTRNLNSCNNICQGTYTGGFWKNILGNDKPTALYAAVSKTDASYMNDKNLVNRGIKCSNANRCCFLLNPTANYYNMQINADGGTFCDTEGYLLGKYILNQPLNNNGIVIISWEHHDIPNLINSLGASPEFLDWPDEAANRFDVVFKLDYTKNPTNPDISIVTQELELQGDSKIIPAFKRKSFLQQSFATLNIMWLVYGLVIVLLCVLIFFLYKKYKYRYKY